MYEQREYAIAWGLVLLFLLLGMLVVCIPRSRRHDLKPVDKALIAREKAAAKRKKIGARKKKHQKKK
jgi:hypothetical protein